MAFRRRIVRRRAPVRTRRGIFRRRARPFTRRRLALRRARARKASQRFTLHARYSYTHTVSPTSGASVQFKPKVEDFAEFQNLRDNFEAYRFTSFQIQVRPLFNVASANETAPLFVIAPWHKIIKNAADFSVTQSIDSAKIYNGTSTAIRTFVPSTLGSQQHVGDDGVVTDSYSKINWRPRVEIDSSSTTIPHYCCLVVWDKSTNPNPSVTNRQYEITLRAKIIMYNQKLQLF